VTQPESAVDAMCRLIPTSAWRLGAVHVMTTLTGSALIALAVSDQAISSPNFPLGKPVSD
jgi:chaperone required for assembly of F1-ATPase